VKTWKLLIEKKIQLKKKHELSHPRRKAVKGKQKENTQRKIPHRTKEREL
jgi:hypothetical protein